MDKIEPTSADLAVIIQALESGPLIGLNSLIARAALIYRSDIHAKARLVAALREQIERGTVLSENYGTSIRLSLTRYGLRFCRDVSRTPQEIAHSFPATNNGRSHRHGALKRRIKKNAVPTPYDLVKVLEILETGPVISWNSLIRRAGLDAAINDDDISRLVAAVREQIKRGNVTIKKTGDKPHLALTCNRRRPVLAIRPKDRLGKRWMLGAAGSVFLVASCMTLKPNVPRTQLMGYPTPVGIHQVRNDDGRLYFEPCNPCQRPTPKTPVIGQSLAPTNYEKNPTTVIDKNEKVSIDVSLQSNTIPATLALNQVERSNTASPLTNLAAMKDRSLSNLSLTVRFDFAESTLTPDGKKALEEFSAKAHGATAVYVRGSTDSQGNAQINEALAKARATAVRENLIANGVESDKIKTSHCTNCFIATNNTKVGRKANRRVDIQLTSFSPLS